MEQKIFHAIIPLPDKIVKCDVIFWQEKYWLVPGWLADRSTGKRYPERIISLDNLEYQRVSKADHQFVVNTAIPENVLRGEKPIPPEYHVIERPDIEFYTQESLN